MTPEDGHHVPTGRFTSLLFGAGKQWELNDKGVPVCYEGDSSVPTAPAIYMTHGQFMRAYACGELQPIVNAIG